MADDEHNLLIARDRAAKAQALLDNPLLVEMFDAVERQLVKEWIDSPPSAGADRERAWQGVRILRNIRDLLEKAVTFDGKLAERALDALHPNKIRII